MPKPDQPDIPAPTMAFILDGREVVATERVLKALEELGASLIEQNAKADPPSRPDLPSFWTWARIYLGDLNRDVVTFQFGGDAHRPKDGLAAVAIVPVSSAVPSAL